MMPSKLNSIAFRIAVAIVLAIILGLVMAFGFIVGLNSYGSRQDRSPYASDRAVIIAVITHRNLVMLSAEIAMTIRAAASVPRSERQRVIAISAAADPELRIALDEPAPPEVAARVDYNLDRLGKLVQIQLQKLSPSITVSVSRPLAKADRSSDRDRSGSASGEEAVLEAALPDGQRIAFAIPGVPSFGGYVLPIFLASLFFGATLIAFWTARRLARPIRDFANAAERLGVEMAAPALAVRGPHELRTAIRAFNLMQERLQRFLEDRTQMLAAISHDLRAPLARLRLRAEFVEGGEQQRKMFGELETMNAMIDSTLAFARDATRQEPRKLVDLSVLVEDVCEDVTDGGGSVRYIGPRGVNLTCRPSAMLRAVTNLVDNAVKYGTSAEVHIVCEGEKLLIVIDDHGPGIPPQEYEKVFAPFYRLDAARNPGKAGVGLGLSVARTVAREHGGDVKLMNRDNGGLRALIELPA
jgi:signal transduction histidine kinase